MLVLATLAALAGHRTLPLAVAAATWAVQAHAGYAVVAPALVAFAIVGVAAQLGWARRQGSPGLEPSGPTGLGRLEPGRFGVDLAIAAGVGLVMWAPPLVDEFTNEPGNLTILWQHFSSPDEAVLGLREAARPRYEPGMPLPSEVPSGYVETSRKGHLRVLTSVDSIEPDLFSGHDE